MRLIVATSSYPCRADEAINAGVFVRDIAGQLSELGHQVHVFTPAKGEPITGSPVPVATFEWGRDARVLTRLNPFRPRDLRSLARIMLEGRSALRRLAAQIQAEAVLAMWAIPAGYWASAVPLPYVVWALGSDVWGVGRYPLGSWVVKRILRKATHVFADGLLLAAHAERLAGRKCEFLASGRRLPVASVGAATLGEGWPHCVFIGRWDLVKGVDILLDAMEVVVERLPSVRLHLFGGGPLETRIRRQVNGAKLRNNVTVYGYADPVTAVAYLKACDMLVIPSRKESIPVAYSDALQCGCPVVATSVGDLEQLILRQHTGVVCPSENAAALAEAICGLASAGPGFRAGFQEALVEAHCMFDPAHSAAKCSAALTQIVQNQ